MKKKTAIRIIVICSAIIAAIMVPFVISVCENTEHKEHSEPIGGNSSEDEGNLLDDSDILTDTEYQLLCYEVEEENGVYVKADEFAPGTESLKFEYPGMYTYTYRKYYMDGDELDTERYDTVSEYGTYLMFGNSFKLIKWESQDNPGEPDVEAITDPNSEWIVEGDKIIHTVKNPESSSSIRAVYTKVNANDDGETGVDAEFPTVTEIV